MTDTYTPTRFAHHPENVPEELKADPSSWVCCDEDKVPLVATLSGAVYAASSTDPHTWRSYEDACIGRPLRTSGRSRGWVGSYGPKKTFVGVDLDKCLDQNPASSRLGRRR